MQIHLQPSQSLTISYQGWQSSLVNIPKELAKAIQISSQYRRMYTLPGRSIANVTGAKISSTASITGQLTNMPAKKTVQFSQKVQSTVQPTTGKSKQAGQSTKVAIMDTEFIDKEYIKILSNEDDASLIEAKLNMLLADLSQKMRWSIWKDDYQLISPSERNPSWHYL